MKNLICKFNLTVFLALSAWSGTNSLFSQAGNLKSCLSRTRLFVELYNSGQYQQFYRLFDSSLQSRKSYTQFQSFMIDSLRTPFGKISGLDHLEQTNDRQIFSLRFEKGLKLLSIQLDPYDAISNFDILPGLVVQQEKSKSNLQHNNPLHTSLDSIVHKAALHYLELPQTCALSIGLIRMGKRYTYHYGETERGNAQLPDDSTIYEAGSITKTFTALLLAHSLVEGRIDSSDDIRGYLPGRLPNLAYGNTPITTIHLANHSSGLPRLPANLFQQKDFDTLNPYKNYTDEMFMEDLRNQIIETLPGQQSSYSNYGMAVLGKVLEKANKKKYEELVIEKIFAPLGMTHSSMRQVENKRMIQGYTATGKSTPHWNLGLFTPAGALLTGTQDMLKYLAYQLEEKDKACKKSHQVTFSGKEKYALAWQIEDKRLGGGVYWHNGATFGFTSFCAFAPQKQCAIVILSNAAASTDHTAIQILKHLLNTQ